MALLKLSSIGRLTVTLIFCFSFSRLGQASVNLEDEDPAMAGNQVRSCVCQQTCSLEENRLAFLEANVRQQTEAFRDLKQAVAQLEDQVTSKIEELSEERENITSFVQDSVESNNTQIVQMLEQIFSCPKDFTHDIKSGICIKLYKNKMTWNAANDFCRDKGQGIRLVVLDTVEKLQFVQALLKRSDEIVQEDGAYQYSVGGQQEDNEGRWLWSTGQEVQGGFGTGQPSNAGGNENCLLLARFTGWPTWAFNDGQCTTDSAKQMLICEYQIL